ncbi:MAG: hypothetical protein IKO55_03950 [Kiritimatiellae bacterium]|nr:hypothetical protein [Kiritimatiellia bacterium]
MTNAVQLGKPEAGNPHIGFDEGEVAPCTAEASLRRVHCRRQPEGRASVCAATPRRGSLLYKTTHQRRYCCFIAASAHLFAVVALMSAPALAEDFFLRGNDGYASSSLNGSGTSVAGWTNAVGTVSKSMTAGNSYFIPADKDVYLIRAPESSQPWTAPEGASLTVNQSAALSLALKTTATVTFGDVYLGEGSYLWLQTSTEKTSHTVDGRFFMSEGSELKLANYVQSSDFRLIYLSATASGKGTISSVPMDSSATSRDRSTFITGDLSGFTGNLVSYCPNIVTGYSTLQLTGEKSIPADPAPGETASVVVTNGASILVGQDWISGTNRVWDFGSGRPPRVIVSPRKSVVIRGRATGSAGFLMDGSGALVFDGETDISGTVTVSNGVVDVKEPAMSMDSSVTWSVSAGASVHFPDSVTMPVLYLKATDTWKESSMSGTSGSGGWAETPGGAETKTAAVMKKRYVVDNGYVLRSPNAGNRDYAFGGNTLTVNNGVVAHALNDSANTSEFVLTIYDMRVSAGGTCKLQGVTGNNKSYGWGGNYEIGEGALLSFCGLASQTNMVYANISGTGKLQFPVNTQANPPSKQDDYLYGNLSAFTGVIEAGATGSGAKPVLAFATAKSFPGDTTAKTEQGLAVTNGVKLVFSASGSIGPNRGVFFGNGTQTVVDVAAGETVEISSDVLGASGFEKTGAGTLVLTGNLKGLSGTVKVSEGTLSLPCESRCRTFMLDVAEGATVTHAPPPGLMLFVR